MSAGRTESEGEGRSSKAERERERVGSDMSAVAISNNAAHTQRNGYAEKLTSAQGIKSSRLRVRESEGRGMGQEMRGSSGRECQVFRLHLMKCQSHKQNGPNEMAKPSEAGTERGTGAQEGASEGRRARV